MDELTVTRSWGWGVAVLGAPDAALPGLEDVARTVVCDVVLLTPDRRLSLGDADGGVELPAPDARTRVVVSTDDPDPTGLDVVWVDLLPAPE